MSLIEQLISVSVASIILLEDFTWLHKVKDADGTSTWTNNDYWFTTEYVVEKFSVLLIIPGESAVTFEPFKTTVKNHV